MLLVSASLLFLTGSFESKGVYLKSHRENSLSNWLYVHVEGIAEKNLEKICGVAVIRSKPDVPGQ